MNRREGRRAPTVICGGQDKHVPFDAMADALCYCKGLKPKNKIGFAFGAYGWSGEGAKQIAAVLTEMGMEQPCELMQVKYMPNADELKQIFDNGVALASALLEKCGN